MEFRVVWKPRSSRRVVLQIERDGSVVVRAPKGTSAGFINEFLQERAAWIEKHRGDALAQRRENPPPRYADGARHLYLGEHYELRVRTVNSVRAQQVLLYGGTLHLGTVKPTPEHIKLRLDQWYRRQALEVFGDSIRRHVQALDWLRSEPAFGVRLMKSRWGSCSSSGRLSLNTHLVKAPLEIIDYVVLHELCHLREHNHGPRFYRLMEARLPHWKELEKQLVDLAPRLIV